MLKVEDYVLVYRSDYGYQIEEFGSFDDAIQYVLSGQLHTGDWFIAKTTKVDIKEQSNEQTD